MDSYTEAESWVQRALERETFEQHTDAGDEIEVRQMQKCDCIPVSVGRGTAIGSWDLIAVTERQIELLATYRKRT